MTEKTIWSGHGDDVVPPPGNHLSGTDKQHLLNLIRRAASPDGPWHFNRITTRWNINQEHIIKMLMVCRKPGSRLPQHLDNGGEMSQAAPWTWTPELNHHLTCVYFTRTTHAWPTLTFICMSLINTHLQFTYNVCVLPWELLYISSRPGLFWCSQLMWKDFELS